MNCWNIFTLTKAIITFPGIIATRNHPKKGKDSPSKYIATAVEALIAAIYLDNKEDFSLVVKIAEHWKKLIDKKQKNTKRRDYDLDTE